MLRDHFEVGMTIIVLLVRLLSQLQSVSISLTTIALDFWKKKSKHFLMAKLSAMEWK